MTSAYPRSLRCMIGFLLLLLACVPDERSNLTIVTHAQVSELLFEGKSCVGVVARINGARTEFRTREVILSCGAIHSPAHLLRA